MTDLDRDLQRLFAADARARVSRKVVIARRRQLPIAAFAAVGAALALAAIALLPLLGGPSERVGGPPVPHASPSQSPAASPSPSAESCPDPLRRQPGDPVVGGSKLPGSAALELRPVRVSGSEARWIVVFAVSAATDRGTPLDVAARATLRGPAGVVPILGYEAGPEEAHTSATTSALRILPCSTAVLVVRTAPVGSGEHTLTLDSVTAAGRTTAVPIFAPLTCTATGPTTQCVNARGTRTTPDPSPATPPRSP